MITLNLNKPLLNLDGSPMKEGDREIKQFNAVANALATSQNGQPLKCYDLALRFYSGSSVEVDESDFTLIRDVFEKSAYVAIIKAPILRELDTAKAVVKP
jgi:hypothetical protein